MNAPANLSINDQIRARDGDDCWACGFRLDFDAAPNSKKSATREHLLAVSLGGTNDLSNLVFCHPGCNKMLGARTVAEKLSIRAKLQANKAKLLAGRDAKNDSQLPRQPAAQTPKRTEPQPIASSRQADRLLIVIGTLRTWQIAAMAAGGLALLSTGFSLGLLLG